MVTRILEQQGPSWNVLIPTRTLENRPPSGLPKVTPRKNGTSTWRTGRELHDRIKNKKQYDLEEQTLSADDIEAALRQELQENEE